MFVVLLLCFLKIPYNYKFDYMFPYFCLGLIMVKKQKWIFSNSTILLLISSILFLLLEICWKTEYIYYYSKPSWWSISSLYEGRGLVIDYFNIFCIIIRYITDAVGFLFFFLLFYKMNLFLSEKYLRIGKYGAYTLEIFILQCFFVSNFF